MNVPYSSGSISQNIFLPTSSSSVAVRISNTTPTAIETSNQLINSSILYKDTSINHIKLQYKASDASIATYIITN